MSDQKNHFSPLSPLVIGRVVPMMKGNTVLILLVLAINGGSSGKSLLHCRLRPRADTAGEVGIATHGREVSRSRSEIMVRKGSEGPCANLCPRVIITTGVRVRLEGRCDGDGTVCTWEATVLPTVGLPVDGLHAVLEVGRRTEFPLADDRPDDSRSSDADSNDDEDRHSSVGETGRRFWCT